MNDISNRLSIGQKCYQPIDTKSESRHRRHPIFHCENKILIKHHGLIITIFS